MLNAKDVIATIAVKDLGKAKEFYEGKLGLKQLKSDGENFVKYKCGNAGLVVYKSQFAGGYKATVATWSVGEDLEKTVDELKNKGVKFEHYDMPGVELKGDIHVAGNMSNAWCTDPDGNILSLIGM